MPHASDVTPTSHNRHDTMLVAALAAGDLAATDRDQAIALTATCADCASLRDDLVAIARATAVVPPPISAPNRDFRLTPADAARLQPGGWRRFVAAFSAPRLATARPLGVGLTTLGLVGLLIGNIPLGLGGSAAGPTAATSLDGSNSEIRAAGGTPAGVPAASGGDLGPVAVGGPVASNAPAASIVPDDTSTGVEAAGSRAPDIMGEAPGAAASAGAKSDASNNELFAAGEPTRDAAAADPLQPRNLLLIVAVLLGLALLVVSRIRSRRRA
jgi:hypothetical protein